mmetsp:Transcript_18854/g.61621  ORF Transcript_18854/g.61621 Transcript_18854/m.61621 type:complete len:221 (-) Transcript_18854:1783-2445(-)|eukprot:scaffold17497_cov96-Isochrysis_galbana.AAC.1
MAVALGARVRYPPSRRASRKSVYRERASTSASGSHSGVARSTRAGPDPPPSHGGSSASAAASALLISAASHGRHAGTTRRPIGCARASPWMVLPSCSSSASTVPASEGGSPPRGASPVTRAWTHETPPSKSPSVSIQGRTAPPSAALWSTAPPSAPSAAAALPVRRAADASVPLPRRTAAADPLAGKKRSGSDSCTLVSRRRTEVVMVPSPVAARRLSSR